ncbi:glycosyl hydrolase family 28-related protein [Flavicella sediminum]|uniref:glycosyl hydrolase family 28-related protein n=1 Tax=Flavicella sediminum TaxID=2585141 RepID=UPI001123BA3F|nr:glycosyl hydrolase family 28-related protein [Flavicella sediminum]
MILKTNKFWSTTLVLLFFTTINAQYKETLDPNGFRVNLKNDYGLVDDNASEDQSQKLLKAIDAVNRKRGGGIIEIPKGTYQLFGIRLKSNVHLLIDAGTVIKPSKNSGLVFSLDSKTGKGQAYIENVSIRGVGGKFIIDYHTRKYGEKQRGIMARMVKNFLIENMIVKDNYSTYCGIILTLTKTNEDISDWEVSRPTNGIIRNINHFRANPGYGLVQCHGAQSVHFENLYSLGGIALRLEVGANILHVGVFDITAKNIVCEKGGVAVLMGPHSAKFGTVKIDGVTSIGCGFAVIITDGHVKHGAPDQTPGYFGNDSYVKNIRAIFGTEGLFKGNYFSFAANDAYYDLVKIWYKGKFLSAPSIAAVKVRTTTYKVKVENITMEGFTYFNDKPILTDNDTTIKNWQQEKNKWVKGHQGPQWKTDKGVIVSDYSVENWITKNPYE